MFAPDLLRGFTRLDFAVVTAKNPINKGVARCVHTLRDVVTCYVVSPGLFAVVGDVVT